MRLRKQVLAAFAAAMVHAACAQDNPVWMGIPASLANLDSRSTGTLRLQFLDAKTGAAVLPDAVLLNGTKAPVDVDASGLLLVPGVPDGSHEIQVEAANYQVFTASATISGVDTMVQTFELDPLPGTEDDVTTPSANECVVHGHIVDDLRGTVLVGATISIESKNVSAVSDSAGRYQLSVSSRTMKTGRGENAGAERVMIIAAHNGYKPRAYRSMEIPPGSSVRFPIRLQRLEDVGEAKDRGSSEPEVIEGPVVSGPLRQRASEWVFDVTVR